jgi:hypothetical protein
MAVKVKFDDGPAGGHERHYGYLAIALPSLALTGRRGEVQAVYHRADDLPDPDGFWHYRHAEFP